jgi:probable rRNA maturation factor
MSGEQRPESADDRPDGWLRGSVFEMSTGEGVDLAAAPAISLDWLMNLADAALPLCLESALPGSVLAALVDAAREPDGEAVSISLVDDATIARVHEEFLGDPEPTDVITFDHGEILISVDTAARQGELFGTDRRHETALYLVHGLLHLAGWDDHEPGAAAAMATRQSEVLTAAASTGGP